MREKKVKKSKPKPKVKKEKTVNQKEWEEKCREARKEAYKKWKLSNPSTQGRPLRKGAR
jgi:hypothetical protein